MSPVEFKAGDFENVLNTECNTVSFIEKKTIDVIPRRVPNL